MFQPQRGIAILCQAIRKAQVHPAVLTSIHPALCQVTFIWVYRFLYATFNSPPALPKLCKDAFTNRYVLLCCPTRCMFRGRIPHNFDFESVNMKPFSLTIRLIQVYSSSLKYTRATKQPEYWFLLFSQCNEVKEGEMCPLWGMWGRLNIRNDLILYVCLLKYVLQWFWVHFVSPWCLPLQLCLLAKNFKPALSFLDVDITEISREVCII